LFEKRHFVGTREVREKFSSIKIQFIFHPQFFETFPLTLSLAPAHVLQRLCRFFQLEHSPFAALKSPLVSFISRRGMGGPRIGWDGFEPGVAQLYSGSQNPVSRTAIPKDITFSGE
jgi:hypothetical protein